MTFSKIHSRGEERALLGKAKQGDQISFEKLESANRQQVMASVMGFTKNFHKAEEIYQCGLIKAWKKIKRFKGDCRFSTWLHRICYNLFCDAFRKRQRLKEDSLEAFYEEAPHAADAALYLASGKRLAGKEPNVGFRNIEMRELKLKINKALSSLPKNHKKVLEMFVVEDLTYEQIARKLRCPVGTIMSRLFYARKSAQKAYGRAVESEKRYEESVRSKAAAQ